MKHSTLKSDIDDSECRNLRMAFRYSFVLKKTVCHNFFYRKNYLSFSRFPKFDFFFRNFISSEFVIVQRRYWTRRNGLNLYFTDFFFQIDQVNFWPLHRQRQLQTGFLSNVPISDLIQILTYEVVDFAFRMECFIHFMVVQRLTLYWRLRILRLFISIVYICLCSCVFVLPMFCSIRFFYFFFECHLT